MSDNQRGRDDPNNGSNGSNTAPSGNGNNNGSDNPPPHFHFHPFLPFPNGNAAPGEGPPTHTINIDPQDPAFHDLLAGVEGLIGQVFGGVLNGGMMGGGGMGGGEYDDSDDDMMSPTSSEPSSPSAAPPGGPNVRRYTTQVHDGQTEHIFVDLVMTAGPARAYPAPPHQHQHEAHPHPHIPPFLAGPPGPPAEPSQNRAANDLEQFRADLRRHLEDPYDDGRDFEDDSSDEGLDDMPPLVPMSPPFDDAVPLPDRPDRRASSVPASLPSNPARQQAAQQQDPHAAPHVHVHTHTEPDGTEVHHHVYHTPGGPLMSVTVTSSLIAAAGRAGGAPPPAGGAAGFPPRMPTPPPGGFEAFADLGGPHPYANHDPPPVPPPRPAPPPRARQAPTREERQEWYGVVRDLYRGQSPEAAAQENFGVPLPVNLDGLDGLDGLGMRGGAWNPDMFGFPPNPPEANANAHAPDAPPGQPQQHRTLGALAIEALAEQLRNIPLHALNINLPTGLFGPPEPDWERAKTLLTALDVVPEGLLRRIDRVEDGGGGKCAVCWGRLSEKAEVDEEGEVGGEGEGRERRPKCPLEEDTVLGLPCTHTFHAVCLFPWLATHTTCPVCRFDLDPDSLTLRRTRPRTPAMGGGGGIAPGIFVPIPVYGPGMGVVIPNPATRNVPANPSGNVPANIPANAPAPHFPTVNLPNAPHQHTHQHAHQHQHQHPQPEGQRQPFLSTLEQGITRAVGRIIDELRGTPPVNANTRPQAGESSQARTTTAALNLVAAANGSAGGNPPLPSMNSPPLPHGIPPHHHRVLAAALGNPSASRPIAPLPTRAGAGPRIVGGSLDALVFIPPPQLGRAGGNIGARPGAPPVPSGSRPSPTPRVDATSSAASAGPSRTSSAGPSRPLKRKYTLPLGTQTLRQRVTTLEERAGLRCSEPSCGFAPRDEDSPDAQQPMKLPTKYPLAGGLCPHKFHASCLVSSCRVKGERPEMEGGEGTRMKVVCPVCKGGELAGAWGWVEESAWEEGEVEGDV